MKEDHSSASNGDNRAGGDGIAHAHAKRLDSASSSSSDSSVTESPVVQLMERKSDARSEESGHYRFPSSVFSRTKSNTGTEWSVNSNESLFSIRMGNMSLNKDLYWIAKSGELGKNGEPLMVPPLPLPDLPPPPTPAPAVADHRPSHPPHALLDYNPNPHPEGGKRNTNLDEGLCATPEAVETMKSVLLENAGGQNKESASPSTTSQPRHSNKSGGSTTSFAFPILTGNNSSKKNQQPRKQQREESPGESPKPQTPKPAPAATAGQAKCFSCFSCCSGTSS